MSVNAPKARTEQPKATIAMFLTIIFLSFWSAVKPTMPTKKIANMIRNDTTCLNMILSLCSEIN